MSKKNTTPPPPPPKPKKKTCPGCAGSRIAMEIDTRTGFAKNVKCETCKGTGLVDE